MNGYKINDPIAINEFFTVSRQKFEGGYFFGGESHSFYEVVCVLGGRVGITAEKKVYLLTEGQMTVHRPGEFHAIWEDGESKPELIIFSFSASPFPKIKGSVYALSPELICEIKNIYKASGDIFRLKGENLYYGDSGYSVFHNGLYIDGVVDGRQGDAVRFFKRLEIFLSSALETAVDENTEYIGAGSENYARILSVMGENIDKNLSLGEIARLAGMSVPTLEKTVFRYLHCGTISYYNILRMERARTLLINGSSVKEVALILGYSNQNYFSACFKKRYGVSPSALKKRA